MLNGSIRSYVYLLITSQVDAIVKKTLLLHT